MKKRWFRLISTALLLIIIFGMLPCSSTAASGDRQRESGAEPVYVFTAEDNELIEQDVFAQIERVEEAVATQMGGMEHMSEQSYVNMLPQVIQAIENSETYVPGTLQQNGVFLVWETTVGIPCCFDPRMEAKLHQSEPAPSGEAIAVYAEEAQASPDNAMASKSGPVSTKIGLIQPYWESSSNYADASFNRYSPVYLDTWEKLCTATGGEGMRYCLKDASVDNIAEVMCECGMVMFDSHGSTDYYDGNMDFSSQANCSYLCLVTSAGVTSADTAEQTGPYGTYYHCLKGSDYAYVSGTCIANHMNGYAPNSFLYMGICLGMATDGMQKGLRDHGVEAVYGYSQSVSFVGDTAYLRAIGEAVRNGGTVAQAVTSAKETLGPWDCYNEYPSVQTAIQNHAAFPIVVSSEDPYPGHGSVDALQDVHSSWSLFGSNYSLTAVSNNTDWGTVSVHGYTVVAQPAPGYYVAGCTVLSGSASVRQNGDSFYLSLFSDCTVRVNFAAKTPAMIRFMANGAACDEIAGYVGDEILLPESCPTQVPGWSFKGWVNNPIAASEARPVFCKPGARFTPEGDTTFYALYVCVQSDDSDAKAYELVSKPQQDWNGNYLISYGTDGNLCLFTGLQGSNDGLNVENAENTTALAETEITLEEELLYDVPDAFVFTLESRGENAYSLQSVSTGTYYGSNGFSVLGFTNYAADSCDWIPGVGENASGLRSTMDCAYPFFGYVDAYHFFWADSSVNPAIRLWKETEFGSRIYSTNPNPFEDVGSDKYFYDAVQWAWRHEPRITSGTDASHFSPYLFCTREQIVFFLWAAAGKPAPSTTEQPFTDVEADQYYADAVRWAKENDVTKGISETVFGVGKNCTRAQIVTFLWRATGAHAPTEAESFRDVPNDAYYADAVAWAVENHVAAGTGDGYFRPSRACTRAETMTFLYAAREIIENTWRQS